MRLTKFETRLKGAVAEGYKVADSRARIKEAKATVSTLRGEYGFKESCPAPFWLTTPPEANPKLAKGESTWSLFLAPATATNNILGLSGDESVPTVCAKSTAGCREGCLSTAGRGGFSSCQRCRALRTLFFWRAPALALGLLLDEIGKTVGRSNGRPLWRLNGTSDIRWEHVLLPGTFQRIRAYDYTKHWDRQPSVSLNYHLTLSASERVTDDGIAAAVNEGKNVAVVTHDSISGGQWGELPAISGDNTDNRRRDRRGRVVTLTPKGRLLEPEKFPKAAKFIRTAGQA